MDGAWQPVVAAAQDVYRDEVFTAVLGEGSRCNGRPVRVPDPVELSQAAIGTEYGYSTTGRARQSAMLAEVAPRIANLRSTGSTVIDLCWVAVGRLDGFVEDELGRWDWAAGALLVTEAGGRVSTVGDGVLAGGQHLHKPLAALIETSAERPVSP